MTSTIATRLAVVTGSSGGIGQATALRLHRAGYAVVAHYSSNGARAQALKAVIEDDGGHCLIAQADLSSSDGIRTLIDNVDRELVLHPHLELQALVNNAARLIGPSFGTATIDQFDDYFALNTRAPFFLAQALSERMRPGGSIVNISSAGAHFSSPGDIVYAMSKAAVESLSANGAEALAERQIRMNTVVPGFTDNGHEAFQNPDLLAYFSGFSVLGGVSMPDTVAEAILFLLSDSASRTTGSILDVSGGSTLGARPSSSVSLKNFV